MGLRRVLLRERPAPRRVREALVPGGPEQLVPRLRRGEPLVSHRGDRVGRPRQRRPRRGRLDPLDGSRVARRPRRDRQLAQRPLTEEGTPMNFLAPLLFSSLTFGAPDPGAMTIDAFTYGAGVIFKHPAAANLW